MHKRRRARSIPPRILIASQERASHSTTFFTDDPLSLSLKFAQALYLFDEQLITRASFISIDRNRGNGRVMSPLRCVITRKSERSKSKEGHFKRPAFKVGCAMEQSRAPDHMTSVFFSISRPNHADDTRRADRANITRRVYLTRWRKDQEAGINRQVITVKSPRRH